MDDYLQVVNGTGVDADMDMHHKSLSEAVGPTEPGRSLSPITNL